MGLAYRVGFPVWSACNENDLFRDLRDPGSASFGTGPREEAEDHAAPFQQPVAVFRLPLRPRAYQHPGDAGWERWDDAACLHVLLPSDHPKAMGRSADSGDIRGRECRLPVRNHAATVLEAHRQ